jgi:hypothetical protein
VEPEGQPSAPKKEEAEQQPTTDHSGSSTGSCAVPVKSDNRALFVVSISTTAHSHNALARIS